MKAKTELNDSCIGEWVYYIPFEGCSPDQWEKGKIKRYENNREVAFVIYNVSEEADWHNGHWLDFTDACTNYRDLYFPKKA